MDTAALTADHFASAYERYAALMIARAGSISTAALMRLFDDHGYSQRRNLLALPDSPAAAARKHRLAPEQIELIRHALAQREHEIIALGAFDAPVFRNIAILGERLRLSPCEQAILALALIGSSIGVLRELLEDLGAMLADRQSVVRTLAHLFALEESALRLALDPRATLIATGLVTLNLHDSDARFLDAQHGLVAILFDAFDVTDALFARFATPARAPKLTVDDFAHLGPDLNIVTRLLARADQKCEPGINIMLYGPPGTGKTELARLVAREAGLALREIRHSNESGADMTRARYHQVVLAQRLMRSVRGIALLFDEAEDLLPHDGSSDRRLGKAAFNDMLESNEVPMIWISNSIEHIDRAYLRRFAYCLEVKMPSRTVRRRIVAREFGSLGVPSSDWLDAMSAHAEAAPGQSS